MHRIVYDDMYPTKPPNSICNTNTNRSNVPVILRTKFADLACTPLAQQGAGAMQRAAASGVCGERGV